MNTSITVEQYGKNFLYLSCHEPPIDEYEISKTDNEVKITKKPKILVVEDERINQTVASMFLTERGYEFDIADTGELALELYKANHYAAILMDMGLPGTLQGTDVTRKIRNIEVQEGKNRHIPIIACTANGLNAKEECLAAGMDDFSIKPFNHEKLALMLKFLIKAEE